MHRRIRLLLGGLAGLLGGWGWGAAADGAEPRRPNVVVLIGDDMGYADVGFHGCTDIPTPNLDALAKSGVRCRNGYVSGPYCSPTRAGF